MAFDPSTAKVVPVNNGRFDPSTARPVNQDERTFFRKTRDFVTGVDRKSPDLYQLPELPFSGVLANTDTSFLKGMGLSAAALTTMDPNELADIIASNVPEVVKLENRDAMGNTIPVLANQKTGAAALVNRPGFSAMDAAQVVGSGALYATGASGKASPFFRQALKTGLKTAAIQSGIESGQGLSGGSFDKGDVLAAGLGGAIGEAVFPIFGKAWSGVKSQILKGNISQSVKNVFVQEAKRLGIPEEEVTEAVIKKWAAEIDNRTGLEREFDVTLSQGQRSGDVSRLTAEDRLRSGAAGDKARDEYLRQERMQLDDLNRAASGMQEDIARGSQLINRRNEAGSALRQGVQNAELIADDAITQAYKEVGEANLSPGTFRNLLQATKKATEGIEFPTEKELVPAHRALLNKIKSLESQMDMIESEGQKIEPIHFAKIEELRRVINTYYDAAANKTDRRSIQTMKNAFDDYMDEAVIKGLFSGDEGALKALKSARSITRDYFRKFGRDTKKSRLGSSRDPAGEFVTKIILENPTDEQVINSLWSASGFNNQAAAKLAQRYKSILGSGSDEWNMVRQAAFNQIVAKKTISGTDYVDGAKTLANLKKAKDKGGSVLKELFSADEIAAITRFAALAKKTAPDLPRSRANPSGTGAFLERGALRSLLSRMPFLMEPTYAAAAGGGIFLKGHRVKKAARDAFRPFERASQSMRLGRGVTTSTTTPAISEEVQERMDN